MERSVRRVGIAIGALVAFASAACVGPRTGRPDGPLRLGDAAAGGDAPHSFAEVPLGCVSPIDVVFVIDVSTSMGDDLERIRAGLGRIYETALALTSEARFSMIVFVDDVLVIDECRPAASRMALETAFDTWRAFCETNKLPTDPRRLNYDCEENSLDALHAAATRCPWRDGATHLVVHVTDDTFREPPEAFSEWRPLGQPGLPARHSYAETVAELVAREIRVGMFAPPGPGAICSGGRGDVARGYFQPYRGVAPIPELTRGRAWSIFDVRDGHLDMSAAINQLVIDSHCLPF